MALSASEAREIYTWLTAGWPNTLKPGASEEFVRAKMRELIKDYARYSKDEVLEGIDRWRANNEKFPTTKNIINEIEWLRSQENARRKSSGEDPDEWPMLIIYDDGYEACYGIFTRAQFVNHPKNSENLEPEEWLRRYGKRRDAIIERMARERKGAQAQ